jgi:hypothetical protein
MALGAFVGLVWAAACSASRGATTVTGGGGSFTSGSQGGAGASDACAHYALQAESFPVHLYILFDKSSSMAGNKWAAAVAGLTTFVEDDASAGVRAAVRFFPRDADGTPLCDQHAYQTPDVPFAELPGGAPAIVAALAGETPDGFSTPIYTALGGGILAGIDVVTAAGPEERAAVLLVTDGKPESPAASCSGVDPNDPAAIASLAATGANHQPPVRTYVVGLPGVDATIANQIALAGGTDSAILVGASDVEAEFRDALAKVRGDALPCSYAIPEPVLQGDVEVDRVNIEITPGEGDSYTLPLDPNCTGEGWRYDDATNPTVIVLCDATCDALKIDNRASIDVVLGCVSVLK